MALRAIVSAVCLWCLTEAAADADATAPTSPGWANSSRCECCKTADGVDMHEHYRNNILKYCSGGDVASAEPEAAVVQTTSGFTTLNDAMREQVCASPMCRSSIISFWASVRFCSPIAYWRNVALAWMTAKIQCAQKIEERGDSSQHSLVVMGAAFRRVDTRGDGPMRSAEAKIHASMLASLQATPDVDGDQHLKVQCERVDDAKTPGVVGPLPQVEPPEAEKEHKPLPCPQVASIWPSNREHDVRPDVGFIVLRFDQCVTATTDAALELSSSGQQTKMVAVSSSSRGNMLVFPLDASTQLESNVGYSIKLRSKMVRSCAMNKTVCADFSSSFATVTTAPKVVRTELLKDRYLRTIFNMPVKPSNSTPGLRLLVRRAREPGLPAAQSPDLQAYFPLTPSQHMVWVDEEWGNYLSDKLLKKGNINAHSDGSGSLAGRRLRCAYADEPPKEAPRCGDFRTFEVDLCAQEGFCDLETKQIPCGMEVEARFPKSLALRASGGQPSASSRGVAASRTCEPPALESDMQWQQTDGILSFSWSEPVQLESASKRVWLCEVDTPGRRCILGGHPLNGSAVEACEMDGCTGWTVDLLAAAAQMPECGRVELRIEAGAVRSVASGRRNALGRAMLKLPQACPIFQEESKTECWMVTDSSLERRGADNDNLRADLKKAEVSFREVSSAEDLWARLAARTFMPACVIFPGLRLNSAVSGLHTSALFEYTRLGGQLYFVGGRPSIQALEEISGLTMTLGLSGNHQILQKELPFEATTALPAQLPVLNQVVGVRLDEGMSGKRGDVAVAAHGIYHGRQESPGQANGYGALEVHAGKGLVEYLAFDWHEPDQNIREPWIRLFKILLNINEQRRASSGTPATQLTGRRLTQLPEMTAEECGNLADGMSGVFLSCSLALRCSSPEGCNGAQRGLMGAIAEPASPFYRGAASLCLKNLSAESFTVPQLIRLSSPCPSRRLLARKMIKLNAACQFLTEGDEQDDSGHRRFRNDTTFLEAQLAEASAGALGLPEASFGPEVRGKLCRMPLCRGFVDELHSLLAACPNGNGYEGKVARIARGLHMAAGSCSRALLGKAEPYTVQAEAVVRGVNTISNEEMEALRGSIFSAVADRLGFERRSAQRDLNRVAAAFGDAAHVTGAGYTEADLKVSVEVQPVAASAARLGGVSPLDGAPITQKSMAFVPKGMEGGDCSGCTVHNLQMLSVQPSWNASGVDPTTEIHVTFEDFIEKVPRPGHYVRVFPTSLRSLCERPETQLLYFPTETGMGEMDTSGGTPSDALGIPASFVCQTFEIGNDANIKVSGETLQIRPEHPLMRNMQYTVKIPPWTVRGSQVGGRNGAAWLGWPNDESAGDQEYTFHTGDPKRSDARVLITVGCDSEPACERLRGDLFREVDGVTAETPCFLSWFRCQADPTSPRVCPPGEDDACNARAPTWEEARPAVGAASITSDQPRPLAMRGEPVRAKLVQEPLACPWWAWLHVGLALCAACLAAFRATAWACDEYRESREFDPYVCQITRLLPYKCAFVSLLSPLLAGALGVAVALPAFWGMVGPLREAPMNSHIDSYEIATHLNQQVEHAFATMVSCSSGVVAAMAFGVIARFKGVVSDRGQVLALLSSGLACSGAAAGACGWLAAAGVDELHYKQTGFEVTILAIVLSVVAAVLLTSILVPLFSVMFFMNVDGIGDIVRYYLRFIWMQRFHWRDQGKPIGHWSQWVLHIREVRGIQGFLAALRARGHGDGLLSLRLYCTDNPTGSVSTRGFSVRAGDDSTDVHSFEGESLSISITNPFSVVVIDVMFQTQVGAQAERIASSVWDPWTKEILSRCFTNWPICNPENSSLVLWNPRDLDEFDGSPKPDTYSEFGLDLTPAMGLLSFQATHLGPMKQISEQEGPLKEDVRSYPLGDTVVATGGVFYRRAPIMRPEAAAGAAPQMYMQPGMQQPLAGSPQGSVMLTRRSGGSEGFSPGGPGGGGFAGGSPPAFSPSRALESNRPMASNAGFGTGGFGSRR